MGFSIDAKAFTDLRNKLKAIDEQRELVIATSRELIKATKQAIYALHRGESADLLMKELQTKAKKLADQAKHDPSLEFSGPTKAGFQEYVEACLFYAFINNKPFPTPTSLNVHPEFFLLGVCDFSGELVRAAINGAINHKFAKAAKIRLFVEELYGELLKFDFRNGELRKKFDAIKYGLEKLEDLALKIKLK